MNKDQNNTFDNYTPANSFNYISVANIFINRIGHSNLMSEKIFPYALNMIRDIDLSTLSSDEIEYYNDLRNIKHTPDFTSGLVSRMNSNILRKVICYRSHDFRKALNELMNTNLFTDYWHIIADTGKSNELTRVVTGTFYDPSKSLVLIKFNDEIKDSLFNVDKNFTTLDPRIIYNFKSIYSFSLYQLLKQKVCLQEAIAKKKKAPQPEEYEIQIDLSELKFLLGALHINTNSSDDNSDLIIKKVLDRCYDSADDLIFKEIGQSKSFHNFGDFRRYILDVAYREINGFDVVASSDEYFNLCKFNNTTDLHFRYAPVRAGKGGKVVAVKFFVSWVNYDNMKKSEENTVEIKDDSNNEDISVSRKNNSEDFINSLGRLINENFHLELSSGELSKIASVADFNFDLITSTLDVIQQEYIARGKAVTNFTGLLIDGINKHYEPLHQIEVKADSEKAEKTCSHKTAFGNFNERDYDFDELLSSLIR